jgi:hypothetical protein
LIYCVVPRELEDELYDTLVAHYRDNPNVTVIIDRRSGPNRRSGPAPAEGEQRQTRDRRRSRVPGTFPSTDPPGG